MYLSTVHFCTVDLTRKINRDKKLACFCGFSSDPDDRLQSPLQVIARVPGLKLWKPLRSAPFASDLRSGWRYRGASPEHHRTGRGLGVMNLSLPAEQECNLTMPSRDRTGRTKAIARRTEVQLHISIDGASLAV